MIQRLAMLRVAVVIGGGATWYSQHVHPPDLTTFTGRPKPVDADTIDFDAVHLRLHSIDAPNQRGGKCTRNAKRARGRAVAICHVAGVNLNEWLVRQGWAVAFAQFSGDYNEAEDEARSKGRGLWQPGVQPPVKWWQKYHEKPRYAGAT